ncbi:hypothetical protein BH10BAC2_BH10BAC2_21340 [soil metagenome]
MFNKNFLIHLRLPVSFTALLFVCMSFPYKALAQNNLNALSTAFNHYHESSIKEKIFVHTDKNFYLTGEIIWLKVYNTDAGFHKPLNISKVAYVEILDTANKPVLQAKIALDNSEGKGSLYVPQTLVSGNYKLRAYTNWMKNFDAAYFFEKNITLVNLQKNSTVVVKDSTEKFDIRFFPEGGDLVNGLQSKVAFKAVTKNGKSFDFKGYIIDGSDTLFQFEPTHSGMGNFSFTPSYNHIYKAFIQPVEGKAFTIELPLVYEKGYVMQVTESGTDKLNIVVETNTANASEVYLLAHTGESVKVANSSTLQNGKAVFSFSKSMLAEGVSHFTIFNMQKKPVCERLYFKKPSQILALSVNADHPVYNSRTKVNMDISYADAFLANDAASLSMSVYRLDSLQTIDDNTIETYLLLSSDLHGSIEDPRYYFTANDKEANAAADNLMLTNGWRRFKWNDVLSNQQPVFEFIPEYNGHIITGKVINTKTGEPQSNIETFLSVPGSLTAFNPSISDAKGLVKFEMKKFFGGSSIVAQPNTMIDSLSRVEINDPFSKNFSDKIVPAFQKPISNPNTLLDQSISMQVQNIYAANKLKQFNFPDIDTSVFYVNPDFKYNLDDYTRFTSLEEVLREYVALVNVTRRNGRVFFPLVNQPANQFFYADPLVLLDGVPVFNFNKFLEFDPLKLKSLEVVTRRYLLGNSIFEGILNWKTYKADLANYEFNPNVLVLDYEGLQMAREFYAPVYDNEASRSSHLPDFRNVLQWSPDIKVKNKEKKSLSFYTSDLPGKYAVVIQGITSNGVCGSKVITFDVKK